MHDQITQDRKKSILELIRFTLIALIIILPIRFFIAKPFIVQGESMEPNFDNGQYLIVDQLTYHFKKPARGDVVVFIHHIVAGVDGVQNDTRYYIKRIIGLPGETVTSENGKITITNKAHPEGLALSEPYLAFFSHDNFNTSLSDGEYFVLGDNRPASSDSHIWGPLLEKDIVGRPALRLFPFSKIGLYPEKATSNDYHE